METLQQLRKEKKIRVIDIASKLGVSQGHYSNLEHGKRPMHDDLLAKVATILGESKDTIATALNVNAVESYKLKSWLSNIRINGLPFIRAFKYQLEASGKDPATMDNSMMKKELQHFIESNIGYSVLAELSEKKNLIEMIRSKLENGEVVMKEPERIYEQPQGNN